MSCDRNALREQLETATCKRVVALEPVKSKRGKGRRSEHVDDGDWEDGALELRRRTPEPTKIRASNGIEMER